MTELEREIPVGVWSRHRPLTAKQPHPAPRDFQYCLQHRSREGSFIWLFPNMTSIRWFAEPYVYTMFAPRHKGLFFSNISARDPIFKHFIKMQSPIFRGAYVALSKNRILAINWTAIIFMETTLSHTKQMPLGRCRRVFPKEKQSSIEICFFGRRVLNG